MVGDLIITFIASLLIWCLYLIFIVLLYKGKINKEVFLHAVLASIIAWVIAEALKHLIPSMRPFTVNNNPIFTLTMPTDNAFPSGHTAAAFGLAVAIWFHNRKLGFKFIVGAMLVGIGRVLANVHFPIDITSGSLIGIVVAYILKKVHFSA